MSDRVVFVSRLFACRRCCIATLADSIVGNMYVRHGVLVCACVRRSGVGRHALKCCHDKAALSLADGPARRQFFVYSMQAIH